MASSKLINLNDLGGWKFKPNEVSLALNTENWPEIMNIQNILRPSKRILGLLITGFDFNGHRIDLW